MTDLRLRYQTIEFGGTDIHLCTLRDRQQFSDPEGVAEALGISSASWPLFGVVWPSSLALARFMDSYDTSAKRILEVGCGIALPSLLLNAKKADITATDYHPAVATFLERNAAINNAVPVAFERTGWADHRDGLGTFDVIIGSDLLYEDEHSLLLAEFINGHAKAACEVIIVDPGRGRKNKLTKAMTAFGYVSACEPLPDPHHESGAFAGYVLTFTRSAAQ